MDDNSSTIVVSLIRIFIMKILELGNQGWERKSFQIGKDCRFIIRNFIWNKIYGSKKLIEREEKLGKKKYQYTGFDTASSKAALVAFGVFKYMI